MYNIRAYILVSTPFGALLLFEWAIIFSHKQRKTALQQKLLVINYQVIYHHTGHAKLCWLQSVSWPRLWKLEEKKAQLLAALGSNAPCQNWGSIQNPLPLLGGRNGAR